MKHQEKIMTLIFYICLMLTVFSSVARADDAQTSSKVQIEEMTEQDREILAALNDEFSVTLKPLVRN